MAPEQPVTLRDIDIAVRESETKTLAAIADLSRKLDGYIAKHAEQHVDDTRRDAEHLVESERITGRVGALEARRDEDRGVLTTHEDDIHELQEWRAEMRGMARAVQFALGASVLSAVVGLVNLLAIVRG